MPQSKENGIMTISTGSIFKVFFVALFFFLIYYLRDVVLVILTSIVIASFVHIVADRMTKYRFNHTFAVILIYAASLAALAGLFYLFIPILLDEVISFSALLAQYFPESALLSNLQGGTIIGAKEIVSGISANESLPGIIQSVQAFSEGFRGNLLAALSFAFGGILNLILIFVISFYLSIQENGIEGFLRLILPATHEEYAVNLWKRSQRKIALWIRGQLVLGLLAGIIVYLGLSLLGVRYALILAITAAILELIPFGLWLSAIPAVFFAYLDGGIILALMVAAFYLILQQFENYLIQPLVVKKTVGISPLVVIISILIGFSLAGFWGVLLAIPVAVPLLEFIHDLEREKILAKANA